MLDFRTKLPSYKMKEVGMLTKFTKENPSFKCLKSNQNTRKYFNEHLTNIFRRKLHLFHSYLQTILDSINNNQIVVLSGETGCGKTTQVSQWWTRRSPLKVQQFYCKYTIHIKLLVCFFVFIIQVSQFILDDFIERGEGSMCRVVCTQPRRISAISVSVFVKNFLITAR